MSCAPRAIDPSINGWNADYIEAQYSLWLRDGAAVPPDLASFFEGFRLARSMGGGAQMPAGARAAEDRAQHAVSSLIERYRAEGHLCAAIDPFGRERACPDPLTPQYHGLSEADLDRAFDAGSVSSDGSPLPLRRIIEILDQTYCHSVGAEIEHINDDEEREWLLARMERSRNRPELTRGQRVHVLYQLYRSELFERFCGKRYPGVKRFSLEGSDALIPFLDRYIELSGDRYDVEEIVVAMSHRGRLNVLTNIIGKTYEQIFTEFEDAWEEDAELGGGDVKYHRGFSGNRTLPSGKNVWLALASNPSHLESACAVALGRCRAKQRLRGDSERSSVTPLLIHGDAAAIGQGVMAEIYNMSQLPGYTVGGTVHVVVNNLIGFTTGPEDARTSRYCTDIAKMIDAPIFHVNGEDPEAVVHVAELALEYRMKFRKDVVIDLIGYRRHGHNETDEAMFTQPALYAQIKKKPSVVQTYAQHLTELGILSEENRADLSTSLDEDMDRAYLSARKKPVDPTPDPGHRRWVGLSNEFTFGDVPTRVCRDDLIEIAGALGRWPDEFTPHRKLIKLLKSRSDAVLNDEQIDWGVAEALSIGSLLIQGIICRFSGQDSRRGTFSHRHAVLRDVENSSLYVPLNFIREQGVPGTDKEVGTVNEEGRMRQAKFCIYDSPLSEYSVLGFEYGFSLASPQMLVCWEAQFGDFANGAQVVIDQFIASAEAKWQRWSGVVLLLPHGYEGQGPEHSSARIERFLKLCGLNNIQVANPSTPAQYFHLLRRQVLRKFRKPLVVFTPKSLLRLPACMSTVAEFTDGGFQEFIDDSLMSSVSKRRKVKRIILCTGKVYYDLDNRRNEIGRDDVAILRVEQLYPFHADLFETIINQYPKSAELIWCQEEPRNMGAWGHMSMTIKELYDWDLQYMGREVAASPATGSPRRHKAQLEAFLSDAVGSKEAVAAGAA